MLRQRVRRPPRLATKRRLPLVLLRTAHQRRLLHRPRQPTRQRHEATSSLCQWGVRHGLLLHGVQRNLLLPGQMLPSPFLPSLMLPSPLLLGLLLQD
jgi:hypothetical protein